MAGDGAGAHGPNRLGLALFCQAITIGFDKLTADERGEVAARQQQMIAHTAEAVGLGEVDRSMRLQLHSRIRDVAAAATTTRGRRR